MFEKIWVSLMLVVVVVVSTAVGEAQTVSKQDKRTEEVRTKVQKLGTGTKVIVKVKLYSDVGYEGYVSQADNDSFVVVDKGGSSNTVKYSDVKSIGGKNMSTGAKVAIGVGIGVGVTLLILYLVFEHITRNN
jgi:hypothetical protein